MKKSILVILVLICGISIVQAETAQRTAKQPSFFIPEDAMKAKSKPVASGRYFIQNVQSSEKSTKTPNRSSIKLTASKLTLSPNAEQPKKLTLSAHKNIDTSANEIQANQNVDNIQATEVSEAKAEQIQFEAKTPASMTSDNETASNITNSNPSEQTPDSNIEVSQTQTPTVEPEVFQIIFDEYYRDTENISKTRTYQNERLQNVIASFVDEDHVLN